MWKVSPLIRFRPLLILAFTLSLEGFFLPSLLYAQGVQYTRKEAGDGGTAVPYPLVTVCTSGAAYTPLPCTPKASIYSDAALSVPLANPFRGDMFGNIEFYATPAAYIVSVTAPYSPGYSFKMSASGGFAGTIQDTQVAVGTAANTIGSDGNLIWAPSEEDPPRKKLTVQGGLGVLRPYNYTNALNSTWSIDFAGHQANAATASFGAIQQKVISNTNGAVTGQFDFFVENAGTPADVLTLTSTGVTSPKVNGVLQVGIAPGQYASLQAAHDALPAAGGTVFVTATGTPFGAAGTTALAITKSGTYQFDCAVYTYSGSAAQAISIASANAVTMQGCGNANGQPSGATASRGTQIVVTNTAANGIDANGAPGLVLQNFTMLGPNSGTGKCLVLTGNSAHVSDLNCRAFGSNGVEIDGTRGNSNNVTLDRATSISNAGWGFNVFGVNGNLIVFNHTSGSNNALGNYQIATATNVFVGAHSQTSGTGTGVTFASGGSFNSGSIYSESGDEATAVAFAAGANNNLISLSSQLAYTNAGTNNGIITNRLQLAGAGVGSPTYSFSSSPTTGFYDGGGGAVVFSSGGVAIELFSSLSHRLGSAKCFSWSSNTDPTAAGNDAGLCRESPNVVDCGNGTAADKSCQLNLATVSPVSTTVAALPAAAAGNKGWIKSVSDSTAIGAEGQTCVGGSTNTALAFSNGTVWKCF